MKIVALMSVRSVRYCFKWSLAKCLLVNNTAAFVLGIWSTCVGMWFSSHFGGDKILDCYFIPFSILYEHSFDIIIIFNNYVTTMGQPLLNV